MNSSYPMVNYRFAVVIFAAENPIPVDIWFQEASGLAITRSVVTQGNMITMSPDVPMQTLTLKRGVVKKAGNLTNEQIDEMEHWGTRLLRKDILVCALDGDEDPVQCWLVENAYLESWTWDSFNAESNGALVESMTFKYRELRYVPSPPGSDWKNSGV